MKNRLIFIFCPLLLLFLNLNGQTTDHTNFLNGLISAYSMESSTTVNDEIGINNGTVTGTTVVPGNLGNALNFTGSQASMGTVPTSQSLDLNGSELSFMVDIYPTANGQSGKSVIFQKGVGTTGRYIYGVAYTNTNKIRFRNVINGVQRDFISSTAAPLNMWSRIICVWKSGEARIIRINSATDIEGTVYSGTQGVFPDRDITIGSYDIPGPAATRSFTGRIDNIMIWNRALTTTEQNTLINENLGFSDFTVVGTDTQAPTAPTVSSTGQSSSTVDLSWSGATDDIAVTGYKVYQNGGSIATLGNVSNYQVSNLQPATTYSFTVTALDASGNESTSSIPLSVTTDSNSGSGSGSGSGNSIWSEANTTASYTGEVAIGRSTVPANYKLAVEGNIRAREIRVDTESWPDYVFKDDYDLPTLVDIQKHILEKGHLPNIPSAQEVQANGVELGEMNRLLLEKIEELILHLLQQEKKLQQQQKELQQLKSKL